MTLDLLAELAAAAKPAKSAKPVVAQDLSSRVGVLNPANNHPDVAGEAPAKAMESTPDATGLAAFSNALSTPQTLREAKVSEFSRVSGRPRDESRLISRPEDRPRPGNATAGEGALRLHPGSDEIPARDTDSPPGSDRFELQVLKNTGHPASRQIERPPTSPTPVYRYRLTDKPDTWLILIAPGDDLNQARMVLENQFGKQRLIEVVENG